jgi:methylmalonyl-CoA mutase
MDFITEIAKMRAGRVLWSEIVSKYDPKNKKSMALRTHCQTSGYSLTAQDVYNNLARTTIEAMAAVFGGTQSLHTNSLDEAIALPTDLSAKYARETQKYLQSKMGITQTVDPWGGAELIENKTIELIQKAKEHIKEIEEYGGMASAIEQGIPKIRIEEASARKQSLIDSGQEQIVGVNIFQPEVDETIDILKIDNSAVRESQIKRLKEIKGKRDTNALNGALEALAEAAATGKGNLLELAVNAARHRATCGEISAAMEMAFGRFKAVPQLITGVYSKGMEKDKSFHRAKELSDQFANLEGRRPRIMVAKLGQDGHDRGAKIIATSFADLGFDVDIGPLFQTAKEAAQQAVENDVHILGISSLAAGHKTLVPQAIQALKDLNREDIIVIVGGVIPPEDYDLLFEAGAAAVFGPGTVISVAATKILEIMIAMYE